MSNYEKVYVDLKDAEGVTHTLALYRAIDDASELYPTTSPMDDWWINNNNLDMKIELGWPDALGAVVIAHHAGSGQTKEFIHIGDGFFAVTNMDGWDNKSVENRVLHSTEWAEIGWKIEEITERGYQG